MERIKIFTYVKNEENKLREWILYHAYLVGLNNLYIIDNCSNEATLEILSEYEKRGLNVFYNAPDYELKGKECTKIMHQFKDGADLLIPLDGDEFIGLMKDENNYSTDRDEILTYIKNLPVTGQKYAFERYLTNVAKEVEDSEIMTHNTKYHFDRVKNHFAKKFYPTSTFIETDHGNHYGKVNFRGTGVIWTDLILFHYVDMGFDGYIGRAFLEVEGCGLSTKLEDLQEMKRVRCIHKVSRCIKYLTGSTTKENYNKFVRVNVETDALSGRIRKLLEIENREMGLNIVCKDNESLDAKDSNWKDYHSKIVGPGRVLVGSNVQNGSFILLEKDEYLVLEKKGEILSCPYQIASYIQELDGAASYRLKKVLSAYSESELDWVEPLKIKTFKQSKTAPPIIVGGNQDILDCELCILKYKNRNTKKKIKEAMEYLEDNNWDLEEIPVNEIMTKVVENTVNENILDNIKCLVAHIGNKLDGNDDIIGDEITIKNSII